MHGSTNPTINRLQRLLAGAMALVSALLALLLAFVLRSSCSHCVVSIVCSVSTWILLDAKARRAGRHVGLLERFVAPALLTMAAILTALFLVGPTAPSHTLPGNPVIISGTTRASLKILKELKKRGAKFYGTQWCGFCNEQRELLGNKFYDYVEYFDCTGRRCKGVGGKQIRDFPTWEVGGKEFKGLFYGDELAEMLKGMGRDQG
jgi:hypothetical protein